MFEIVLNPRREKDFFVQSQVVTEADPSTVEYLSKIGISIDMPPVVSNVTTRYKAIGYSKEKCLARKLNAQVDATFI